MKKNRKNNIKKNSLWKAWRNKTIAQQESAKKVFDKVGLDLRSFYRDTERQNGEGFSEFPDYKIRAYKIVFGEVFISLYEIDEQRRMNDYINRKEEDKVKKVNKLHAEMLKSKTDFEKELSHERHATAV